MKKPSIPFWIKLPVILLIIAGAVYGVYYLLSQPDGTEVVESEVSKKWAEGPAQESFNVTLTYSDSAKIKAILDAGHVVEDTVPGGKEVNRFDRGFTVRFFNDEGLVQTKMRADTGQIYKESESGKAWGNVIIYSDDSSTIETPVLFWDNKEERIWSNDSVRITTKNEIIWGDSMSADSAYSNFRIYKVRGTMQLQDNSL